MDLKRLLPVGEEQKGGECRLERPRGGKLLQVLLRSQGPQEGQFCFPQGTFGRTDCDRWLHKGTQDAWRLTEHSP